MFGFPSGLPSSRPGCRNSLELYYRPRLLLRVIGLLALTDRRVLLVFVSYPHIYVIRHIYSISR